MSRADKPLLDRLLLIRARSLLQRRAEVLADFERETIIEAHERAIRLGGVVSAAERSVIEAAIAAMIAAGTQDLTNAGLAA